MNGRPRMHFITDVAYVAGFTLRLRFEDGSMRMVDLKDHLKGKFFEPLKDVARFRTARLVPDLDTVVWENGADMSPDFLYEISRPVEQKLS
jgi:hypothetical protein